MYLYISGRRVCLCICMIAVLLGEFSLGLHCVIVAFLGHTQLLFGIWWARVSRSLFECLCFRKFNLDFPQNVSMLVS